MTYHNPPASFVSNAVLRVQNLEKSIAFYREALGFQVEKHNDSSASVSADGRNTLVTLQADPSFKRPPVPRNGLFHIAFLLPDRASLGAVLKHLVQHKYQLQGASDHGVSEAVYLSDPEGNGIELYCDRPAETWQWDGDQVQMTTRPLDAEGVLQEASSFQGMPSETIIGHIHLQVNNLDQAHQFYVDHLSFDAVSSIGKQALFLSSESYHHHIGLNTWSGPYTEPLGSDETGLASFQIVYPQSSSLQSVETSLKEAGISVNQTEAGLQAEDPFGITVEMKAFSQG